MATSLIGIVIFYEKDFKNYTLHTKSGIPVTIWARNHFVDEGQVLLAANMTVNLFNALENILNGVNNASLPAKIDVFAIPDYPVSNFIFYITNGFIK